MLSSAMSRLDRSHIAAGEAAAEDQGAAACLLVHPV
jgi:hypothetical protein